MPILLSHFLQRKKLCAGMSSSPHFIIPLLPIPFPFFFPPHYFFFLWLRYPTFILRGFMVQLVITSLLRSEGPRFEPGWNHFYVLDCFAVHRVPTRLPFSHSIIGRFISSRIHPFPSEHGSKDAQSLFSTVMFTQTGTSGNLPF